MLNYEEFKEKVKDEITDHMSSKYEDCVVDIRETKRQTEQWRDLCCVKFQDLVMHPLQFMSMTYLKNIKKW